jgi:hypothetical protein
MEDLHPPRTSRIKRALAIIDLMANFFYLGFEDWHQRHHSLFLNPQ